MTDDYSKNNLKFRSYRFSLEIIDLVSAFPSHRVYWVIQDQLLRSATSIGANIIEAKSSSSKRDFIKYYEISLKSANESKYWLCLLRDGTDFGKNNNPRIEKDLNEVTQISNMLGSSLLTMKNKKKY